ncbi:unnamed protein product [[Actinomadura] parvosata subsp. kistnae]|nr:unnamed protein product [Actinomadura parvosata subsp. kistnae]
MTTWGGRLAAARTAPAAAPGRRRLRHEPARGTPAPAVRSASERDSAQAARARPGEGAGPALGLGPLRGRPGRGARAAGSWRGGAVPGRGGARAAVRPGGVRRRGASHAQRRARLGPLRAGGPGAGAGAGRAVQPRPDDPPVPAVAYGRRAVLLERPPLRHQRAALGRGRPAVRRRPDRLPALPDQPRGRPRPRPSPSPLPRPGRPAPVMVQQSKSLGRCRPNPWPFPHRGPDKR